MRLQYAREKRERDYYSDAGTSGLELSDAANALVMDNLIQVLSDASAEDYGEIPPAQADRAGAQEPAQRRL